MLWNTIHIIHFPISSHKGLDDAILPFAYNLSPGAYFGGKDDQGNGAADAQDEERPRHVGDGDLGDHGDLAGDLGGVAVVVWRPMQIEPMPH